MWAEHKVDICQVPTCSTAAAGGHLLCWAHWADVPRKVRDRCWDAWKRIGEEFATADIAAAKADWRKAKTDALFAAGALGAAKDDAALLNTNIERGIS